jgi:hypothetical protein
MTQMLSKKPRMISGKRLQLLRTRASKPLLTRCLPPLTWRSFRGATNQEQGRRGKRWLRYKSFETMCEIWHAAFRRSLWIGRNVGPISEELLAMLRVIGPISVGEMSQRAGITKSAATRSLKLLQEEGRVAKSGERWVATE